MNHQSSLWLDAWRRLLANKAALAGGIIIFILIFLAIFAPWIAPHSYSYQNLELGAQPPSADFILGTDTLGRDLFSRILYGARVSFLGPAIAGLIGGSFVVETIFQIPGLGRFYVEAAFNRDYTMILGTTIFFSSLIIFFNLLSDIAVLLMNPRARSDA